MPPVHARAGTSACTRHGEPTRGRRAAATWRLEATRPRAPSPRRCARAASMPRMRARLAASAGRSRPRPRARAGADDDEPAAGARAARRRVGERIAADELEDRRRTRRRRSVSAPSAAIRRGARRGGRCPSPRACSDAELHRGEADAAGGAVHEQALARSQRRLREEGVVRGREDLDEAAGAGHSSRSGAAACARSVDDGELGVASAAAAGAPSPGCARRRRPRLAGALEARDVGRSARRRRIPPGALEQVGAVDARARGCGSSTSPAPATGSGRSSILERPSAITAARIGAGSIRP